jgi:hypothetical protein
MLFLAADPAGFSYLSACFVERANADLSTGNDDGELRPSYGGHAGSNRTAIAANFFHQDVDENFALARVGRHVSRLLLGHRFGVFPAPGGTRSSASLSHPSKPTPRLPGTSICAPPRGLGSPRNKFAIGGTKRCANFFRAPPRKQTFGLGSRAHSLGFARVTRATTGIQQTETRLCTRTK